MVNALGRHAWSRAMNHESNYNTKHLQLYCKAMADDLEGCPLLIIYSVYSREEKKAQHPSRTVSAHCRVMFPEREQSDSRFGFCLILQILPLLSASKGVAHVERAISSLCIGEHAAQPFVHLALRAYAACYFKFLSLYAIMSPNASRKSIFYYGQKLACVSPVNPEVFQLFPSALNLTHWLRAPMRFDNMTSEEAYNALCSKIFKPALWLVNYRSVTFNYGPEYFMHTFWLAGKPNK